MAQIYPEELRSAGDRLPRQRQGIIQVLLPAFNEQAALREMFDDLDQTLRRDRLKYHVTVIDDGSSDDTAMITRAACERLPVTLVSHPHNMGLAAAMRTGLSTLAEEADADDIIVAMDSDNTHPIGLVSRMVNLIHEGHDVVVASRFQPKSRVLGVSRLRQFTSVCACWLFRFLFPIKGIRDYTCGYRAYRVEAIRKAFDAYGDKFVSEQGFSCMVDILIKLARLGLICGEAPMILRYDKKVGASKMAVGRTISQTLRLALKRRVGILD